jgi:hypothetical protein
MRERTYTLYDLDELLTDVRQRVLDRHRHINVEDAWWYQSIVSEWKTRLESMGYEDPMILFSGFYCQGDGACFEARINLERWLDHSGLTSKYERLREAYSSCDVELTLRHSGRYYHKYSTRLESHYSGSDDRVARELGEVDALISEEKVRLANEIYRELESAYEGYTDNEAVAETLNANEFEFFKNGRVAGDC